MGDKKKLKTLHHQSLVKHAVRADAWDYTAMYVLSIYSLLQQPVKTNHNLLEEGKILMVI